MDVDSDSGLRTLTRGVKTGVKRRIILALGKYFLNHVAVK